MNRCAVCDYLDGHGSPWLSRGPDKRRVVWRPAHKEYQCDECFVSIRDAKAEKEVEDAIKALENYEPTETEIEVYSNEPPVPLLLVE